MISKKGFKFALVTLTIIYATSVTTYSQVDIKTPKVVFGISSGYDSNIFRVSELTDSNRVQSSLVNFSGKLSTWVKWHKRIKSYMYVNGEYNSFPANNFAREWDVKLKSNTITTIIPQKYNIFGLKWSLDLSYSNKDNFYSNRYLGDEYNVIVNRSSNEKLNLGDLFDYQSTVIENSLNFNFQSLFELKLGYVMEIKNYKDLGDISSDNFYSLDNNKNVFSGDLIYYPVNDFSLKLNYLKEFRNYNHKYVYTIEGNELLDNKREYTFNKIRFALNYNTKSFETEIGYKNKQRIDDYEGYYNYDFNQLYIGASYLLISDLKLDARYKSTSKDYEHLTLGGSLLKNSFDLFELGITKNIYSNLAVTASYVFDSENSTYDKFTFTRHTTLLHIIYRLL